MDFCVLVHIIRISSPPHKNRSASFHFLHYERLQGKCQLFCYFSIYLTTEIASHWNTIHNISPSAGTSIHRQIPAQLLTFPFPLRILIISRLTIYTVKVLLHLMPPAAICRLFP